MALKKSNSSKTSNSSNNTDNKKRTAPGWVADLRYGRSLSLEFFKRNAWLLMVFVVAIIALMGLRYKTKTKMEEIKRLTTELQRAESSKLQEKAAYMSLIRETEMKRLVEEKKLGLDFQELPPYELEIDKN
ncbi:MAG: hypothetical protein K2J82_08640 [Muribaculaceae bacterium]|nr:hypothetical protein [Muribaculaceae bacterium]MDE6754663.1 hypothetical protein [Muribaculaceae bacterium]